MATRLHTFTADELLAMPDDGVRRELVAGALREMPPVGKQHARISGRLYRSLHAWVSPRGLGEAFVEFGYHLERDPDTVRAPDVSFVRAGHTDDGPEEGYHAGTPDLAVEVLSPSDREFDVIEKVYDYLDAGTRMVVLVDPEPRSVTVYRSRRDKQVLTEDDVLDGGDVVPGWKLPVREIFA
ncbi:MAG TPA: Uma2 family endonuclease [Longimicrobium sp.]|nr:Uma2 family endonuclease [Longimicrobium sp.]